MSWPPSLRTRLFLIVFIGVVLPLALIGVWLTRTAGRSGEELLQARLNDALDNTVTSVGRNWIRIRSDLLTLAEQPAVKGILSGSNPDGSEGLSTLEEQFQTLTRTVKRVVIRNRDDQILKTLPETIELPEDPLGALTLAVRLSIFEAFSGDRLGTLEAELLVSALLDGGATSPFTAGMVLAAFDPATQASLLSLPFDPSVLSPDRFLWGGDEWLAVRRELVEPPLRLVVAAPLTPFVKPFQQAAAQGLWWLLGVSLFALLLAAILTARTTASLARLSEAASAVSAGDLERKVEQEGEDEVGRLARAFNAMTENLRETLRQLADRQALAAVGEFASSLAHEIRNPLTSIRIDLQRVEEELPSSFRFRQTQVRALDEIVRLDRTVSGVLRLARSGGIDLKRVLLFDPLRSAAHAAEPEFQSRNAKLRLPEAQAWAVVRGDSSSLLQLFLNLFLNAAQALEEGGEAWVLVSRENGNAVILLEDNGCGISADAHGRVFEPFFSTRKGGTGLGLAIVERIAAAHGGKVTIRNLPGKGTSVRVELPLVPGDRDVTV